MLSKIKVSTAVCGFAIIHSVNVPVMIKINIELQVSHMLNLDSNSCFCLFAFIKLIITWIVHVAGLQAKNSSAFV